MPWRVAKSSSCPASKPWGVLRQPDGRVEGCHPTQAQAQAHQRALYANEPGAGQSAAALTEQLRAASGNAEKDLLPGMVAIYQDALDRAAEIVAKKLALVAAADWQPPAEGTLLTLAQLKALAKRTNDKLAALRMSTLKQTAGEVFARLEIAWDVTHPLARGLLDEAAKRTGDRLGEAVQPVIRETIASSYADGLNVRDTAAAIRSAVSEAAPWQAEMLARTDLNSLANGASKMAAQSAGMDYKTWFATLDDKTRPEHAAAHGQTVPINGAFSVGGEDADYPGDPNLSDAMAANCRCTLGYGETLSEAEGLLADGASIMQDERDHPRRETMATKEQRRRKYERRAAHAQGKRTDAIVAAAIPVHHTGVVSGTWDGNAAMGRCSSSSDFRSICAWVDSGGQSDQRQSYKFPHHANPGGPANINGVRNALARLPQAQIPSGDVAGVRSHLEAHLNDFNRRQGNAGLLDFDRLSTEETAQVIDLLRKASPEELAAMPSGMDSLPAGVKACTLNGTPGYTGGRQCHLHDGTDSGMRSAIRRAQSDAGDSQHTLLAAARTIPFKGTAAIEGILSDDNTLTPRTLLPDSLEWPEMPVSFMAQTVTAEAHAGAEVAGRIDQFARKRGQGRSRSITMYGELTTPFGINEIAPMIEDETMRYVSVDLGAADWTLVDRQSLAEVPREEVDMAALSDGAYALGLKSGKIKAVTLVPTQALEGAMVSLVASAEGDEATLTFPVEWLFEQDEALIASAAPVRPPRAWFETPEPPGKMPLTVTEDGRVYGHLATWDSCHMSFLPSCIPPPKSHSAYSYFHVCELDTSEGDVLTVGKLMFSPTDGGHADRSLTAAKASQYYDRTGMAAAYLRVTDGKYGIWASGSLNPDLSDEQRQEMRRQLRLHPPSGDWRPVNGAYEMICALSVAIPGFPVPRTEVTLVASGQEIELAGAIISSSGWFEPDPEALAVLEGIEPEATAERRMQALVARADGMDALAALVE